MDLHIVSNEATYETGWLHEDMERAKFRRLTDEQESFQALHLSLAETLFKSEGRTLTADQVRAILTRLEANGYELRRKR